jgi:ethanolamine ammonia-lyase large subunit
MERSPLIWRRQFLKSGILGLTSVGLSECVFGAPHPGKEPPPASRLGEGLFDYLQRTRGKIDLVAYRQLLGAANEFKEGDEIIGVAAPDEQTRSLARKLLEATPLAKLDQTAPFEDGLYRLNLSAIDRDAQRRVSGMTLGELKSFLLNQSEADIHGVKMGLSSDVIACVVRIMSNDELIRIGAKVFNPLPGTNLGAKGYLSARIQPNSPTDHPDDIRWQVFNAFAYAVGDLLIGTNPVSSTSASVAGVEATLKEITAVFEIVDILPHCVLSHIDVQAEVERANPGSTALWFQSIAGNDAANKTFDVSTDTMVKHAKSRTGRFGLYFETGQGADFTNGHGHGVDMVLHESRKYGFARALTRAIPHKQPWVHVNDVAGFIGPEVFRTREQLVRCCLEDIVMGKLHGLMIGLDICSTLHMDISLDDLGWCINQIMPANPGYLMALPTRIDPMLGYLTTSFHDHVHIRERFGFKVDERMWSFFQRLGIIDSRGKPTAHFGDPGWVYLQFCRQKGDVRTEQDILGEARQRMNEVRSRGVFLAEGFGKTPSQLPPNLAQQVTRIYDDAKVSIWKELEPKFVSTIPNASKVRSRSKDRMDYILHPANGERLSEVSIAKIEGLKSQFDKHQVQIVISDGLNALAVMQAEQLLPLLAQLQAEFASAKVSLSPMNLVIEAGRVRAGYRIGEQLFGGRKGKFGILHVIGERPGSGHRTLSIYMTVADGATWAIPDKVDHNITKVVSGIATTTLKPKAAAIEAAKLFRTMWD